MNSPAPSFVYDPFQQEAIDHINQGYSVIVSAPTGAGKTVIAEHVIRECLRKGEKVIYTAPIKALSNQKFRDFQETVPDQIGILTGDVTINGHASVLIMTTEIFRNKVLEEAESLKDYSWIIFDEIHYLDDEERGSVWEESLIFFPEHMKLLGLSATIPNIDQLAKWLEKIHRRPIKIVQEDKRPVPLHFFYQCQSELYENLDRMIKHGFHTSEFRNHRSGRIPFYVHIKHNNSASLISYLYEERLLPCIYFVFSRRRTEQLAEEMNDFNFLNLHEREKIIALYEELCERFDLTNETSAYRLRPFIERGIGYHHAGMLPTLKEVVERLFTSRLLKVIFTTETFALGINMPARSVIFDDLRKFYGRGHAPLKTRDFYQMAGRAGRRGIDTEGFVFCRVNPHDIAPDELEKMVYGKPERVQSQFNASYATLLNLYEHHGEKLYEIYPRSFHHFLVKHFLQERAVDLLRAKVNVLKELGHIRQGALTPKGVFASKVYGYELILSELYDQGILEKLSEKELGILSVAIVYEPRKGTQKPQLSQTADELESLTRKVKRFLHKAERRGGLQVLSKRCYFHLASAMEAWMRGEGFDEILQCADVDEGEIVRFFRMSIQILREIADTPISDELKGRIFQAIAKINHGVIDSEKQLRS
ncbi:MAG: DEAD/DEAH box helicase [Candidatus Omnitrophica bacterium]|nr:DEAD/DEAH box helicase [Candidatus Omnitrophota bacterium]